MMTRVLYGSSCQGSDIVRPGTTPEGEQRCSACRLGRWHTLLLDYTKIPNTGTRLTGDHS